MKNNNNIVLVERDFIDELSHKIARVMSDTFERELGILYSELSESEKNLWDNACNHTMPSQIRMYMKDKKEYTFKYSYRRIWMEVQYIPVDGHHLVKAKAGYRPVENACEEFHVLRLHMRNGSILGSELVAICSTNREALQKAKLIMTMDVNSEDIKVNSGMKSDTPVGFRYGNKTEYYDYIVC